MNKGLPPLYYTDAPPWASAWGEDEFGVYAEFEFKGTTQRMRWIAPGTFLMGSPENETERRTERELQHEVELTEGFWMADTACTQALWEAVMGSNPSGFKDYHRNPTPNRPVETVSWEDCQGFLSRIHEMAPELALRLPTEAEWEYACRAGTETPFSFGESITPDQVNYNGEYPYADEAKGENHKETVAVGTLPANPWGLYEMHGNVWEWCEDWFGDYSPGKAVDPKGPKDGQYRVPRGGSWCSVAGDTRSAVRGSYVPGYRYDDVGFRFVRGRKAAGNQESGATGRHGGGEGTEPQATPRGSGAGG